MGLDWIILEIEVTDSDRTKAYLFAPHCKERCKSCTRESDGHWLVGRARSGKASFAPLVAPSEVQRTPGPLDIGGGCLAER